MVKFAICNELFEGWKIEDVLPFVKQVGYEAVEIAPFTLADSVTGISKAERERIRKLAEDCGLQIAGLHWLLVKPEGLHLTHPEDAIRERTRNYLRELIRFCGDIGGKVMIFGSPKQRSFLEGDSFESAWARAKEIFQSLLPDLEQCGVTLCIEALPESATNFINTVSDCLKLVREINHPNFQTMVDAKSMCAEKRPFEDIICEAAAHIRHVHVQDENLLGPGMGSTDLRPLAKALKNIGYDGFVSVEVFDFSPGAETIARKSIEYLRRVFDS